MKERKIKLIKYCYDKWNKNCDKLEKVIRGNQKKLKNCEYDYLVKLIVYNILNEDIDEYSADKWDGENIITIDNGDYQGTLLFLIPQDVYQPNEAKYLMTYVNYGSCSVCDTLMNIQMDVPYADENETMSEQTVKDFMALCRDLVCHIIKPYNIGWRESEEFEPVKIKD